MNMSVNDRRCVFAYLDRFMETYGRISRLPRRFRTIRKLFSAGLYSPFRLPSIPRKRHRGGAGIPSRPETGPNEGFSRLLRTVFEEIRMQNRSEIENMDKIWLFCTKKRTHSCDFFYLWNPGDLCYTVHDWRLARQETARGLHTGKPGNRFDGIFPGPGARTEGPDCMQARGTGRTGPINAYYAVLLLLTK